MKKETKKKDWVKRRYGAIARGARQDDATWLLVHLAVSVGHEEIWR